MFPGLGWTYPCDIWSVGCILVELCSVCDTCCIKSCIYPCTCHKSWLWSLVSIYSGHSSLFNFMSQFHSLGFCCLSYVAQQMPFQHFLCIFFPCFFWLLWCYFAGGCIIPDTWESGALGHDGASARPHSCPHDKESWVCTIFQHIFNVKMIHLTCEWMHSTPVCFQSCVYYKSIDRPYTDCCYCMFGQPAIREIF